MCIKNEIVFFPPSNIYHCKAFPFGECFVVIALNNFAGEGKVYMLASTRAIAMVKLIIICRLVIEPMGIQ